MVSVKFLMVGETNSMVGYILFNGQRSFNSAWGLGGTGQCPGES